jgi:PAS domain S-box-containing protein
MSLMDRQAIVVADATGRIQLWSRGAEQLFGLSPAQAIGQTLDLVVPADYREAHWQGFHAAMKAGAGKLENQSFDLPVNYRGDVTEVRGVLTLLRDPEKNVIGAMAVFTVPTATTK